MAKKKMSLKSLIKYAVTGINIKPAYHPFFEVQKKTKNKLSKAKIEVAHLTHVIDVYAIKHIINEHGDKQKENKKGQIPITLDVFEKIPSILKRYDTINIVTRGNKIRIIYTKKYKNEIYYIEEILKGKKQLSCVTMYIKKTSKK